MDRVKRCPFCNNKPMVYKSRHTNGWVARCLNSTCDYGKEYVPFEKAEDAIDYWNQKAKEAVDEKNL